MPDLYHLLNNELVRTASQHEGCYGLQSRFCKQMNYLFALLSSSKQYFDRPQPLPFTPHPIYRSYSYDSTLYALQHVPWESIVNPLKSELFPNSTVYKNSVLTSQETHYVTAIKTNRLTLFRETVAVCCESHTEHTNTLCRHNAEFSCVRTVGIYTNRWALKS
jgi:hypothetical protein